MHIQHSWIQQHAVPNHHIQARHSHSQATVNWIQALVSTPSLHTNLELTTSSPFPFILNPPDTSDNTPYNNLIQPWTHTSHASSHVHRCPHYSTSNDECITPSCSPIHASPPCVCWHMHYINLCPQHMHHIIWYPPTHAFHQHPTLTISTLHPWLKHLPTSSHAPCLPLSHLTYSGCIKHIHSSQPNQQPS